MEKKVITVAHALDGAAAQHAAKEVAARIGFGKQASEEIAIVVSELASNLVKHGQGGTLVIEPLPGDRPGIQITATDQGPGIADIEQALTDGFSTSAGLGLGLGTANRLMESLDVSSQPGNGTQVVCKRWLPTPRQEATASRLDIGVATRPYPGIDVNGDAFVVKQWNGMALIGVIDGLGHGQFANLAAQTARSYVETHADQPLADLFRGTGRACLGTRGVVMALARFQLESPPPEEDVNKKFPGAIQFSFASLGNIAARLFGSREQADFQVRRGVIGLKAPNVIVTQHAWNKDCILILHSDGLSTHWQPDDFPFIYRKAARDAAQELLGALSIDNDDATVIVVKAVEGADADA